VSLRSVRELLRLISIATPMLAAATVMVAAQEAKDKAPPAAPATQPPPPPPPGWAVTCADTGKGLACKATQTVVLAKTHQLVLAVSVSKPAGGTGTAILLHLPHGLFIPAGVTMGVDDQKAEMLAIQTCDVKGCYAGAPLAPEKLTAMSKGAKINVTFRDLKNQKVTVPVPLKGFEAAYNKL
jgi:invasion protein IalB